MNRLKSFPQDMPEWQAIQDDYNELNAPAAGNIPFAPEQGGPAPQTEVMPNNYMDLAQQESADQQIIPDIEDLSGGIGKGVVESGQVSQDAFDKERGNMPANYMQLAQDEANDVGEAPGKPLSPQEQMLEEFKKMRSQDKKDLDDARSRDTRAKLIGSLGDSLGTILNARGQMNVKAPNAAVQQSTGGAKAAELFTSTPDVEKDVKSRRDDLMAQYKALKGGTGAALTPYQELALQLQRERLGLQGKQEEGKSERAKASLDLSRDKAGQLSDKVATSFADMATAKKEAQRLLPRVKEAGLGVIGTPYQKARSAMGIPSKEFQALESDYAGVRNTIRNALFGSALTATEIEAFEKELNDISISQEGFEDNLSNFTERVERKMNEKAKGMAKAQPLKEKALAPFMGDSAPAAAAPHGETVERNGKTYKWNPAVGKYQPLG
jgi:hypothetical protein